MEPQPDSDGPSLVEGGPGLYLNVRGEVKARLTKMMTWCATEAKAAGFNASVATVPSQLKLASLMAGEVVLESFLYLPVTIQEGQQVKFKDAVVDIDYTTPNKKKRKNKLNFQPAFSPELMQALNKYVLPENKFMLKMENEVTFLKLKAIPNSQLQEAYLRKLNELSTFLLDIKLSDLMVKDLAGNTGHLCRLGQLITLNSTTDHAAVEYHVMKLNEMYGAVSSNPDPEYPTEQLVRAQRLVGMARNVVASEANITSESLRARHAAGNVVQPGQQLDGSFTQQPGGLSTPVVNRREHLNFNTLDTGAEVATGGNTEPLANGPGLSATPQPGNQVECDAESPEGMPRMFVRPGTAAAGRRVIINQDLVDSTAVSANTAAVAGTADDTTPGGQIGDETNIVVGGLTSTGNEHFRVPVSAGSARPPHRQVEFTRQMAMVEGYDDEEADVINNVVQTLAVTPGAIKAPLGKRGYQRGKGPKSGKSVDKRELTPSEFNFVRGLIPAHELVEDAGNKNLIKAVKRKVGPSFEENAMNFTAEDENILSEARSADEVMLEEMRKRKFPLEVIKRVFEKRATMADLDLDDPNLFSSGDMEDPETNGKHEYVNSANSLHHITFDQNDSVFSPVPLLAWLPPADPNEDSSVDREDDEVAQTQQEARAPDNDYADYPPK